MLKFKWTDQANGKTAIRLLCENVDRANHFCHFPPWKLIGGDIDFFDPRQIIERDMNVNAKLKQIDLSKKFDILTMLSEAYLSLFDD